MPAVLNDTSLNGVTSPATGWRGRLKKSITFNSPDNDFFEAAWAGNDIEAQKRVALYQYPYVNGTVVQDMGANGLLYPLTLYFVRDDHDTDAQKFLAALSQKGSWRVIHPVYGTLKLQPISATLTADPTGSAGVSKVETQWVEPLEQDAPVSTAALGASVLAQAGIVNAGISGQLVAGIDLSDPEAAAAAAATGTAGLGNFNSSWLGRVSQGAAGLQAQITTAFSGAMAAINAPIMDVQNAAANIIALVEMPFTIGQSLMATVTNYGNMITTAIASITPGADASSRNVALMSEIFLVSALVGGTIAAVATPPGSRAEAVTAIKTVNAQLTTITPALDGTQAASAGNTADTQYFSNSAAYPDIALLIGAYNRYLQALLFDLKVAKRFTLPIPRAPIEIAITEYGGLGDGDVNLDLIIAGNGLHGNDILWLPAGREVVVYV